MKPLEAYPASWPDTVLSGKQGRALRLILTFKAPQGLCTASGLQGEGKDPRARDDRWGWNTTFFLSIQPHSSEFSFVYMLYNKAPAYNS